MHKRRQKLTADNLSDLYSEYFPYFFVALLSRLIITAIKPYTIDMAGYVAWSKYLAEHGPSMFYVSSGFHVVYAPFFLYFLWFTGEISGLLSIPYAGHAYFIKLWSVIFEFMGAWLIIKLSEKANRTRAGFFIALIYVLNPGVFVNSSIWGQFDSIPATMLMGVLVLFEYKKPNLGALLFLTAVLTKPQSGLLLPVVLYLYFRDFKFDINSIKKLVVGLFSGVILYLAIVLPFYSPTSKAGFIPGFLDPFYWLLDLYSTSIKDYPYATANAFNFWTLLGGQIQDDALPFMGLTYFWWGNILFALSLVYSFFCLIRGKAILYAVTYFSFMVLFSAFFFMTKMHERYLLPAIIFIMFAALFEKRHWLTAALLSLCVFVNHICLYIISFEERYWLDRWDSTALIFAALTLITYILAIYNGHRAFISSDSPQNKSNVVRRKR